MNTSWSCQGKSGRLGGLAASMMEYVIYNLIALNGKQVRPVCNDNYAAGRDLEADAVAEDSFVLKVNTDLTISLCLRLLHAHCTVKGTVCPKGMNFAQQFCESNRQAQHKGQPILYSSNRFVPSDLGPVERLQTSDALSPLCIWTSTHSDPRPKNFKKFPTGDPSDDPALQVSLSTCCKGTLIAGTGSLAVSVFERVLGVV